MPQYTKRSRSYYKRNKPYKKRKYNVYKGISSGLNTASKIARLAGTVSNIVGMLNTEKKFLDDNTSSTPNTSMAYRTMPGLTQGTGPSNRVGMQIKVVEVHIRACITQHANATNTFIRFGLVIDKQPNGSLPSAPAPFVSNNVDSFFDPRLGERFQVIMDEKVVLTSSSKTADRYIKSFTDQNLIIKYSGNTGTVTDILSNNIVFFAVSNEATNTPTIDYNVRLRYVDN